MSRVQGHANGDPRPDDFDDAERPCPGHETVGAREQATEGVENEALGASLDEAIYGELHQRGAAIDYTLYDAPIGFREFGVQEPDGYDIGIGQPIEGG
jgi:hypothetical protein